MSLPDVECTNTWNDRPARPSSCFSRWPDCRRRLQCLLLSLTSLGIRCFISTIPVSMPSGNETQLSNLDAFAKLPTERIFSSGRRAGLTKIEAAPTWISAPDPGSSQRGSDCHRCQGGTSSCIAIRRKRRGWRIVIAPQFAEPGSPQPSQRAQSQSSAQSALSGSNSRSHRRR